MMYLPKPTLPVILVSLIGFTLACGETTKDSEQRGPKNPTRKDSESEGRDSDTDSGSDTDSNGDSDSELDGISPTLDIERRVGFVTIPARRVTIEGGPEVGIASAEMFYHLIPAEEDAENKPVIVLFNGGPGGATSAFLQLLGTGPLSLDQETWSLVETDHPFTKIANLLYLDARQTGFSFSRGALD